MVPRWLTIVILLFVVLLVLPPILFILYDVVSVSLTRPEKISVITSKPYYLYRPLRNSIVVCGASALISTLLGLGFAWMLARYNVPRRNLLLSLLTGPYIVPSFLMGIGWIMLWTSNGFYEQLTGMHSPINPYGPLSLTIILGLHNYPLAMLTIYTMLANMDASLEEAARIHGVPWRRVVLGILLPLILPGIISGFILAFAYSISEFGAPAVLGLPVGYTVLTTQIYSFMTEAPIEYEAAEVLALVLSLIGVVVLGLNYFILSKKRYATITGKISRIEARKPSYKAMILVVAFMLLVYLPAIAVVLGSLVRTWGKPITLSNLGFDHYVKVLSMGRSVRALMVTLGLSIGAASIAGFLGVLISYVVLRTRSALSKIIDYLVFLPFSIPGLVIGVGLIIASGRLYGPIYGTVFILLIAFIIRFLPYATRTTAPVLMQIDESLEESSRVHGVGFGKTMLRIVFPLTLGALFSSWVFVFNSSMKELSASAILATQVETAIVVAFLLFTDGYFSDGAALTVIIVAITLLLTAVASKLTRKGIAELQEKATV